MKRILVVEDSTAMRTLITVALESSGDYRVLTAANGFEALRILPREEVDLVITDINMPDINGLELISYIRKLPRYATVPLFIVSSEGSDRDREKGISLGANEYLVKPFDPERLTALVESYLNR